MSNISTSPSMNPEHFFDADGFYRMIVERNVALHNEAVPIGVEAIKAMLLNRDVSEHIKILDLASGALPITISRVLEACGEYSFRYRGIDINPEQALLANETFIFPHNIREILVEEGNAWDLSDISDNSQDVVFTGLNLHHGTPEEIFILANEINRILRKDGVFINHDMYRPQSEEYIRRPEANPFDPSDLYSMMPSQDVAVPQFPFKGREFSLNDPDDWRQVSFIPLFREVLRSYGADARDIEIACKHVGLRDFCLSTEEMKVVFQSAGLEVQVFDYCDSNAPLKQFYASLVATKKSLTSQG